MIKNLKRLFGFGLVFVAFGAYAGVLTNEWTDNNNRYCEYSDGEVKKIAFGATCPRTN